MSSAEFVGRLICPKCKKQSVKVECACQLWVEDGRGEAEMFHLQSDDKAECAHCGHKGPLVAFMPPDEIESWEWQDSLAEYKHCCVQRSEECLTCA